MILLAGCLALGLACSAPTTQKVSSTTSEPAFTELDLAGTWRAVLESPGGELPFLLRFALEGGALPAKAGAAAESGSWSAWVINGEEEAPTSGVHFQGESVVVDFTWYDSEITASRQPDGALVGEWRRTSAEGAESRLPFRATRPAGQRFAPLDEEPTPGAATLLNVAGAWSVEFREVGTAAEVEPARGEFEQQDVGVRGTFLTPTGDYRFLAGEYADGWLRLSTFDGAHAFLFEARAQADGSLEGDFWSRDTYHAKWTARRVSGEDNLLPDSWQAVGLTNDAGRFQFSFEDLDGHLLTSNDRRFRGKVVLVNIFGSWCPNCNDEAPLLAAWHRRYGERGLEVVGLAYEFSGDETRDRTMVRRFAERHGIDYPLLLAGTSDKTAAAATLPDLTAVLAYPTTVLIGRDGRVRRIHSGFSGPGTGGHYDALVEELEGAIEELLEEDELQQDSVVSEVPSGDDRASG